jgi:predicted amino acid racemase
MINLIRTHSLFYNHLIPVHSFQPLFQLQKEHIALQPPVAFRGANQMKQLSINDGTLRRLEIHKQIVRFVAHIDVVFDSCTAKERKLDKKKEKKGKKKKKSN